MMCMCLLCKFAHHLAETLVSIRCAVDRLEMLAYGPINRESRNHELHDKNVRPTKNIRAKRDADTVSSNQGIFPLATRQCRFCPLSQECCEDCRIEVCTKHRRFTVWACHRSCVTVAFGSGETSAGEICGELSNARQPNWQSINLPETHLVMGSLIYMISSKVLIMLRRDSPPSLARPEAYKASQRHRRIVIPRSLNFHPDICERWRSISIHCTIVGTKLTNEITRSCRLSWRRIWVRARSNNCIASS